MHLQRLFPSIDVRQVLKKFLRFFFRRMKLWTQILQRFSFVSFPNLQYICSSFFVTTYNIVLVKKKEVNIFESNFTFQADVV